MDAGADVKAKTDEGRTVLHAAAIGNENPEVTKLLIDRGANPNAPVTDEKSYLAGTLPLHLSVEYNEPAVGRALIEAGADPNAVDGSGDTPLHLAAQSSWNETRSARSVANIKMLVSAGADVNGLNSDGKTPFFDAEHSSVAIALLEAGADPNARDAYDGTALCRAADIADDPSLIHALIERGADIEALCGGTATPLFEAASNENVEVVSALIKAGASVANAVVPSGMSALHEAALGNDNPAVFEVFIGAGADPVARDERGRTPLHVAARYADNPTVLETLIAAGTNPNARDEWGRTPLHHASGHYDRAQAIKTLISLGAEPNVRDEDGNTPLHLAARYVNEYYHESQPENQKHAGDAIAPLLDGGGNTALRNAEGKTPWDLASNNAALKGSEGYWRLNDARFSATSETQPAGNFASESTKRPGGGTGECEIPGYPRPSKPQSLGLSWCPSNVDFQLRSHALYAAGGWCAIHGGSSSTPEQIAASYRQINHSCDTLEAMKSMNRGAKCVCPRDYRPPRS